MTQAHPPPWLPHTHVIFNYADYGPEQAVGAIKARVQERGGTIEPLSALKRAREYGWVEEEQPSKFITSDVLANTIVIRFVDLVEKAGRGDFRPSIRPR